MGHIILLLKSTALELGFFVCFIFAFRAFKCLINKSTKFLHEILPVKITHMFCLLNGLCLLAVYINKFSKSLHICGPVFTSIGEGELNRRFWDFSPFAWKSQGVVPSSIFQFAEAKPKPRMILFPL